MLSRVTPWEADHDELMWQDYRWVAMLDPLELASGVEMTDVRVADREGRETWWARMRAVQGYEPRCGCCPLLWSEVSDTDEHDAGGPEPVGPWPSAYDVGLDRATGVVVSVRSVDLPVEHAWFEVSILGVEA